MLLNLALDSEWLLGTVLFKEPAGVSIHDRYLKVLYDKGLATIRDRISKTELTKQFVAFYGADFLNRLGCPLGNEIDSHWLSRLLRYRSRLCPPLRHLLLIRFLGYSAQEFFGLDASKPFGEGPWPCLNPASDHYLQDMVGACEVLRDKRTRKLRGTFTCECGFAYTRWGPDTHPLDRLKKSRVKSYGLVWEQLLRHLSESGASMKGLAKRLHADPHTIKRHLAGPVKLEPISPEQRKAKQQAYRTSWMALCARFPAAKRSELALASPAVARWLRRNDHAWFEAHNRDRLAVIATKGRIDWEARDQELAKLVPYKAEELRQASPCPGRISTNALTCELGVKGLIEKNVTRLPSTAHALKRFVETRESFAARRLRWALNRYAGKHEPITLPRLLRHAGLRPDVLAYPSVRELLAVHGNYAESLRGRDHSEWQE